MTKEVLEAMEKRIHVMQIPRNPSFITIFMNSADLSIHGIHKQGAIITQFEKQKFNEQDVVHISLGIMCNLSADLSNQCHQGVSLIFLILL